MVLSEVTVELAKKLKQEVSFEDRIIGTMMSGAGGNNSVSIYSLQELVDFLFVDEYVKLFQKGKSKISYINLEEVVHWIEKVFGDTDLSNEINEVVNSNQSYVTKIEETCNLLKDRLKQCDEVLNMT